MMSWHVLNTKGRLLYVACLLNMYSAGVAAWKGSWFCIFSVLMAAFCGIMTYQDRFRYYTAREINDRTKTNKRTKRGTDE